ncbi:hypothetical protein ACHAQJ_006286 [Trichoderma viride]
MPTARHRLVQLKHLTCFDDNEVWRTWSHNATLAVLQNTTEQIIILMQNDNDASEERTEYLDAIDTRIIPAIAIDCSRILAYLEELFNTQSDNDNENEDEAEDGELFFSATARLRFQRAAHDLCLAFEAVETQHRSIFGLADKVTAPSWSAYRGIVLEQRTLLARLHPVPAITSPDSRHWLNRLVVEGIITIKEGHNLHINDKGIITA